MKLGFHFLFSWNVGEDKMAHDIYVLNLNVYLLWTFSAKLYIFLLVLFGLSQLAFNLHIYGLQGDDLIYVGISHVFVVSTFRTFSSSHFEVQNAPLTVLMLLCYGTQSCNLRPVSQPFPISTVFPTLVSAYHHSPTDLYYIIYFTTYKWCHMFLYAWLISVPILPSRFTLFIVTSACILCVVE